MRALRTEMTQRSQINRQWLLAERPSGEPTSKTLRLAEIPVVAAGDGQLLLRTAFLSLDPYMRGRMSDAPSYAAPVAIGDVMVGGTVSRVVESHLPAFAKGDWVVSYSGWQDYAVSDGRGVTNLGPSPAHPSWALGVLGMPGFTAWAGLTLIGQPKAGETIAVAAATGPVGATVGQIGKLLGCRVVGIAGGAEKCGFAVDTLGFDACLDHREPDLPGRLATAAPSGIDVYFENVGGDVFDAVLPLLNTRARIPLCGLVSQYNSTHLPAGPDRTGWLMGQLLRKRITVQGFIVFEDFGPRYPEFAVAMGEWIAQGKIVYREDVVDGLENAPEAFIGMLRGDNFGKRVIRVGDSDVS
jgi:NADPH-dependent curcumin reductase CurA